MRKLIFLDIDGTIRDFDGYIPDSAISAIQSAKAAGHKIFLSTGRPYCDLEDRVKSLGFDGIISNAGGYVEFGGKCIRHAYFSPDHYEALTADLLDGNCVFELQRYDKIQILESHVSAFEAIDIEIQKKLGSDAHPLRRMPAIARSLSDITEVEKILYFSRTLTVESLIKKWGHQVHIVPLSISPDMLTGGEISPLGINKAEGVKNILEAGGYSREDVIAIGDNANDIEMIEFASVGIAMGNATDSLKAVADFTTAPLREDGIEKAFRKLNLI